jgi:hypothetical protein
VAFGVVVLVVLVVVGVRWTPMTQSSASHIGPSRVSVFVTL